MERRAKCVDLLWSLILVVPWIKHMVLNALDFFVNTLKTSGNHCERKTSTQKTRTPRRAMNQSRFFFLLFSLHRWKMLKVSKVLRRFWTSWNDGMVLPVLHGKAPYVFVGVVLLFDVVLAYRATALFAPWNLTLAARAPHKLCQGRNSQETSETCPKNLSAAVKKTTSKVRQLCSETILSKCLTTKSWNPQLYNMFFLNSFFDIPLFTFPLTPDSVRRHIQGPSKTMPKRTSDAMSRNRRYEIWDPYWREIIVSGTAAITTFSSSWPSFSCSCATKWNVNSHVTLSFIIVIKSNDYRSFWDTTCIM